MAFDNIRKTTMTNHIQSVIKALHSDDTQLRRVSIINDRAELFDVSKSKAPVLTLNNPKLKLDRDIKSIHIDSLNLLYDLYTLHDYPKLTTVQISKFSQLMLPFATTDDDKLLFPQVATIIISANHVSCIADVLPMNKLFPSADTFVLVFREQNLRMYHMGNYQCIQNCKYKTLVIVNRFHKVVDSEFMRTMAEILAVNDSITVLVVVNMNAKPVAVNMGKAVFEHPVHVCFVNLEYVNEGKCNASAIDILNVDL